jgi:uncharacterized membrane protein
MQKILTPIFTALIALIILCYPFAIYFGIQYFSPRYLALVIAFIFVIRFVLLKQATPKSQASKSTQHVPIIVMGIGLVVCIVGVISNSLLMIKLYPVLMSVLMLGVFGYSLLYPPTVIERLARITEPDLPAEAVLYIRKVTVVWCLFFILNALIALWTVLFASTAVWTFYNGLLSYLLMGLLFAVEFVVRFFVKRKIDGKLKGNDVQKET